MAKEKKRKRGRVTKPCENCNLEKAKIINKIFELKCWHLCIRKDGSQITDPWEIVDDHKLHNCAKCRKEKVVWEIVIYDSKYNPKLSKTCKICIDHHRKKD